jgi:hypothetical protein
VINVVVFAENSGDAEIVCGLADRVFTEDGKVQHNELLNCRRWLGDKPEEAFIAKEHIKAKHDILEQESRRPRFRRNTTDKPQGSYTAFWRKAVELVVSMRKSQILHGVLVHCDADNHPEQREDISQAFDSLGSVLKCVFATPDREIEAWLLNGFIPNPNDPKESKRLAEWQRKLSFDPCTQAERARDKGGDRDPKNILDALTNFDKDRQRQCWEATDLATLRQRGEKTKLKLFLYEVELNFSPMVST